jgi:anti-sigma regulatory factor (Ser/Thr protein kinase)
VPGVACHQPPELQLTAPAASSTPRAVRAAFARTFPHLSALDDAVLCVSEVVTNAVLHAGTEIVVTARRLVGVVRVEVHDGSSVVPVRQRVERTSTTGRGLHLLDHLTRRWGVDVEPGGKVVWLEFADEGLA